MKLKCHRTVTLYVVSSSVHANLNKTGRFCDYAGRLCHRKHVFAAIVFVSTRLCNGRLCNV